MFADEAARQRPLPGIGVMGAAHQQDIQRVILKSKENDIDRDGRAWIIVGVALCENGLDIGAQSKASHVVVALCR